LGLTEDARSSVWPV